MTVDAGRLNRKGRIERRTLTKNDYQEDIETWTTLHENVWAQIQPVTAREKVNGQQITDDVTHILRFRWLAGLTASDRFVYCGRVFNFNGAPTNFQDGGFLAEVTAIEVTEGPEDASS